MDIQLIKSKHIQLWLSTVEIGVGVIFVPENKNVVITLGLLQLSIDWKRD